MKEYFARIGRKGGSRSRRSLSSADARDMVRVREARRAFRDFYAQCFWYLHRDLQVTLRDVPENCARIASERRAQGVLRLIAANRSPDSYVAGATVLHRAEPLNLGDLKRRWLGALERARTLVARLPPDEIGCLYVDADQQPVGPDPSSDAFRSLVRHRGCVRGTWPTISLYDRR